MIEVAMTAPDGVTLDTAGKYCPDNVHIAPALQQKSATPGETAQEITPDAGNVGLSKVIVPALPNYRKFEGEIVSTVVGTSSRALLLCDPVIASHYADKSLNIKVKFYFDTPVAYAIVTADGYNDLDYAKTDAVRVDATSSVQRQLRYGADGGLTENSSDKPLFGGTVDRVGCMDIDDAGNLYIHSFSSSYAIRPCNYTVEIRW